jgi:hypothetical protein
MHRREIAPACGLNDGYEQGGSSQFHGSTMLAPLAAMTSAQESCRSADFFPEANKICASP